MALFPKSILGKSCKVFTLESFLIIREIFFSMYHVISTRAMLIFSISFQFYQLSPEGTHICQSYMLTCLSPYVVVLASSLVLYPSAQPTNHAYVRIPKYPNMNFVVPRVFYSSYPAPWLQLIEWKLLTSSTSILLPDARCVPTCPLVWTLCSSCFTM